VTKKKLTLSRETLRTLSDKQLKGVAGGDTGSLSCGGPDCWQPTTEATCMSCAAVPNTCGGPGSTALCVTQP
jgi:hypothetical protein